MSAEVKLVMTIILLVAGAISFFVGDKKLEVRSGFITRLFFPRRAPSQGKLIGIGLWIAALFLLLQVH